jgi:flavin-dependent dehydrogenase
MLQGPLSPCVTYPAMPGLQLSAARQGEIAIGDAALALDPISGDGLGSGLRSAVLASAVLGAIEDGEPMANTLAHFNQRIELAARSHVGRCIELYQTAAGGEQAQAEINSMVRALARMPPQTEAFHYALGIDQARRAHTERNPV